MTPAQLEQMARAAGLLHGPADDDRARLMLAALRVFRASVLEETAILCEKDWALLSRHECAEAIRELAKQEGQP